MMKTKPSSKNILYRYLLFIPILAFLLLSMTSARGQKPVSSGLDTYLVITSDITDMQLNKFHRYLADAGINISFLETMRNQKGLITHITLSVIKDGKEVASTSSGDGDKPLIQPLVFYRLGSYHNVSGLTYGYPTIIDAKYLNVLKRLSGLLQYNTATQEFDLHGYGQIINYR